ncbi:E3 ubiquitin-protein ligase arih2 [Haplosporangium gracile]|nr:E3 ubiquitin-protein ligase arih2 [Haplosporangium gracile]
MDYDGAQQHHEQHNHDHDHDHEYEHDHEYDNGSDDESEGDAMSNEMEYYLQRCSICFDSRLDFCLELCRDQFCRDCFQKYVKEVVSNSWGLDVTKIKCPVCQDPLPLAEWSKYVDQETLAQYQQYNQPYRSFSRFCNGCDNEVAISRVKQSIVSLPSRDLLPLFESLLEQLKSLLFLEGLNPEASASTSSASTKFSSMDGRKRHKYSGTGHSKRDVRAQGLVQQFIKDYRSFCGTPQGNAATLPSMAQSYFSSLAMRALGGGAAPPTPTPAPAPVDPGQHSNARTFQLGSHAAPAGGQSVDFQPHLDARAAHPQQDSAYRSAPSSLFQRKQQQPAKPTGVLEMYKDLMVSLIELFNLQPPEQNDSMRVVTRTDTVKETEEYGHLGIPTEVTGIAAPGKVTTVADPCGGVTIESVRIPKRTIADRSKIITRAENKRRLEVKKALVRFSQELLSLEVRPEQWKELQFLHVRWCRWEWCNNCDLELCLQCGVSSHHESESCFDHMRSVITTNTTTSRRSRASKVDSYSPYTSSLAGSMGHKGKERSDLDTGTMQWKLANTNPCPNCCILIHRDDGCNKVDCMLCGHRFCWVCREAWDVGCGFFRCRLAVEEPAVEKESDDQWEKHPEEWEDNDVQADGDTDQIETLATVMEGEPPHTGHGQVDAGAMRHDRRRRRSDDLSAIIFEKPEIGVPNVFMIQAKRSRA